MNRTVVIVMLVGVSFGFTQTGEQGASNAASAAQVSASQVTAQRGQTEAQKQKDLQECYNIAKAKTGVDPQSLMGVAGGSAENSSNLPAGGSAAATSGVESAVGAAASQAGQSAAASAGQGASATDSAANIAKSKLNLFSVANQGCVKARGYLVKAPSASTTPASPQYGSPRCLVWRLQIEERLTSL